MDFKDLLFNRRSIRSYQDRPVAIDLVKDIIKESTLSPSSGNEQPWEFIIISNKNLIQEISNESKSNILSRISKNPNDYAAKYKNLLEKETFNVFFNAPCVVFILGPSNHKNLYVNSALAASYFMFSASSRGLGTCWVNLGTEIKDPGLIKRIGFPTDSTIVAPLTLGYPEKLPSIPKRKEPNILKIIT